MSDQGTGQPLALPSGATTDPVANGRHKGQMPRWATASATIASFATQTVAGHQDVYVPLATASVAGALAPADFNKLHNWPVLRLSYTEATDRANASNMGVAGTAFTLVAAQNFTINSTTAVLDVFVALGAAINAPAAVTQATLRVLLDGATLFKASGAPAAASGWLALPSAAFPIGPGLSAGTHTIAVTVIASQANALLYCRAATTPLYEFASINIVERQP